MKDPVKQKALWKPGVDISHHCVNVKKLHKDIEKRRRHESAECALAARTLLDGSHRSDILIDAEGVIIDMNEAAALRMGRPVAELRGTVFFDYFPPDIASRQRNRIAEARKIKTPLMFEESIDGWTFSIHLCPLADETGEIARFAMYIQDITTIREYEKRLEKNEAFLRKLLDALPNPLFCKDLEGRYTMCNRAFEDFFDCTGRDVAGKSIPDLFEKEFADIVLQKDRELFHCPGIQRYELVYGKKNGDLRNVLLDKATLADETGAVSGIVGVVSDITERKKEERKRAEAEHKLRALINADPAAAMLIDPAGSIIELNSSFEKIIGRRRGDLIGKVVCDCLPSSAAEIMKEKMWQIVKTSNPAVFEGAFAGSEHIFHMHPLRSADGHVQSIAVFARNVSTLRAHERKLKEVTDLYRELFENTGTAMCCTDSDRVILMVNSRFEEITGYSKEEVQGRLCFRDIVHVSERTRLAEYHRLRTEGTGSPPTSYETVMVHKGGQKIPVILTISFNRRDQKMIISVNDITELRESQNKLTVREKQLEGFLELLPEMAFLKDSNSVMTMVNKPFEEFTGIPRDAAVGRRPEEIYRRDMAAIYREDDEEVMREKRTIKFEVPMIGKSGKRLWVNSVKSPVFDDSGEVIGIIGLAHDITLFKDRIEELDRQQRKLDHFVQRDRDALRKINKILAEKHKEAAEMTVAHERLAGKMRETKSAFNVLVNHMEEMRREAERRIMSKVKTILLPLVDKIRNDSDLKKYSGDIDAIAQLLSDIKIDIIAGGASPGTSLTSMELQIANLLRDRMKSSEIASILNISIDTVKTHRRNIRRKLNIQNSGINLSGYLEDALHQYDATVSKGP
ncbi:MAG: PAS domain S-box protein [Deltaproteobacteria bacterium]|nr:PAS domain S-box protein [Deltaproteobacteria bacterium]